MAADPGCLLGRSTFKLVEFVFATDPSRRQIARHESVNGDRRAMSFRKLESERAGSLLRSSQRLRATSSRTNSVRSASTRRAAAARFVTTNSVSSTPDATTARLMSCRSCGVVRTSSRSLRRSRPVSIIITAPRSSYGKCTAKGRSKQEANSRQAAEAGTMRPSRAASVERSLVGCRAPVVCCSARRRAG